MNATERGIQRRKVILQQLKKRKRLDRMREEQRDLRAAKLFLSIAKDLR